MKMGLGISGIAVVAVLLVAAMLLMPQYSRPPIESVQIGYRGTGMVDVINPREEAALLAANVVAPPSMPLMEAGPKASEVYENVQVLGDLSQTQFTRLMLAITQWVSPEQGCTYCHSAEGFADDSLYTKRVSRWMIEMTRHINNEWTDHVKTTGVTCNTCHRGNNVPQYVWYRPEVTGVQPGSNAMLGYYKEFYGPSPVAGDTSLGQDPLGRFLQGDVPIRVVSNTALPSGNRASTKQTEQTYALMMHMSEALGVNCTYCHNTRSFTDWAESPPARATAYYGIRLARDIDANYIAPISPVFPPYRRGPHGDIGKVNCETCHQGLSKPLNGVSMLGDYPSLGAPNAMSREDLLPRTLEPMPLEAAAAPAEATPAAASGTTDGAAAPAAPAAASEAPSTDGTAAPAEASPAAPSDAADQAPASDGAVAPAESTADGTAAPAGTPAADAPAAPAEAPAADGTAAPAPDAPAASGAAPATDGTAAPAAQ